MNKCHFINSHFFHKPPHPTTNYTPYLPVFFGRAFLIYASLWASLDGNVTQRMQNLRCRWAAER